MFPAMGRQGFAALLGEKGDDGLAAAGCEDAADAGDGDAGDRARDSGSEGGGEEQFVVFAAMERLGHGRGGMNGKRGKSTSAATADSRQRWARSVERPSLRSSAAEARPRRCNHNPWAMRGWG